MEDQVWSINLIANGDTQEDGWQTPLIRITAEVHLCLEPIFMHIISDGIQETMNELEERVGEITVPFIKKESIEP